MNAEQILKSIIQDGYLSETNMQRAVALFGEGHNSLEEILKSCKIQAASGQAIEAIKRYRIAAGIGLREAKIAVIGY